ncbi:MAG TPA: adenylate/guanylate cyclase domain-containing protein [Candidatus Caenarcaniphilales bacterium]|nr:adenylate/guanylate cyclase domain-containing protein [Candidatus Caenarcaniphilales bacterium]
MSVESPALTCPRCEAPVSADARFCMNCGQPLATTEADGQRQARLSAAAPAPLVDKMRAAKLSGERKPVTALFADVVGSTALAEQMDPEDWTQMMNEAFDLMSQAVFRYEGTIAQLQGDALLAFFGAPVAHEDDPERAVRAAMEMVAAVDEFAQQLQQTRGIDFRIRAGINSGPVVVGNVGTDLRYEYTALGDAVNVAARMQSLAEPGSVLITANTHRLLGGAFLVEDLGAIAVKGKADPVHAYRVLGHPRDPVRRRGLERVGLESPMVGRDSQLAKLRSLFEIVRAGRGRVCFLTGEPGIGKSRLLAELRQAVLAATADGAAATWVEGRCVSYGRNLPYHLLLDLVRTMLGLSLSSSGREARVVFDQAMAELLGEDATDVSPFLAHLLSLPLREDEIDRTKIDPDSMQDRYAAATHRLIRALAARGPVVLVCEDVHWADPASVKVLRVVMPLAAQLPVLFVAALRTETDSEGWKLVPVARELFGESLTEIRLEPLSEADSRALVSNLLVIESLPQRVRDVILARAEGNPFFVEEVVRMLIERGLIERQDGQWIATAEVESAEIPETLHGLLLARIDQLPEQAKRSLRVASVIGRQFPARVLERVLSETGGVTRT